MIKKLFITAAVCILASAYVNAQVIKGEEAQTKRGPYETNRLFDNIFIGAAGGINYYQGEQDLHLYFKDRLAPAIQGYIGKWITPSFGVRVGYYGIKARGFFHNVSGVPTWSENPYVDPVDAHRWGYKQRMRMHNVRGDLMWNISNAIGGYRTDRTWEFAPYIGAGVLTAVTPGKHPVTGKKLRNTELGVTVGLYNMFRVCNALDITLDINQAMFHQSLDGEVAGSRKEFMASVSLGLAYQFHNRTFHRTHAPVDITPFTSKIDELNKALSDINAKNKKLSDDLADERAKDKGGKTIIKEAETKIVPSPFAVYFPLGKSTLTDAQKSSIKYFVENAMATNKDRTFEIIGSADSATGSARTNDKLGQARIDAVLAIIRSCGGNYKLTDKNLGGTDQYSKSENKLNRVVVIK